MHNVDLEAEIERLQEHNNTLIGRVNNLVYKCNCVKQEAIKELAELIVSDYPEMEYYLNDLINDMIGEDTDFNLQGNS